MSLLCAIPLLSSLLSACAPPPPFAVGYVEGEYVLLAPIEVAEIDRMDVRRGDRVSAGATVATLADRDARIGVAQAEAALAQSRAQLADLMIGKRPEEIAALTAAVEMARAQADDAARKVDRLGDLLTRGTATQADYDTARTVLASANAAVGQAKANLAVGGLPARPETIRAAENQVKQAEAALDQARWRLSKRVILSPAAGRISDVIRSAGDVAGPGAPLVSMLPEGAIKLTLYVSEPHFASVKVGTLLDVRCDGCPSGLRAKVSYIAPEPEFTPPVIYSLQARQKLVYRIEARPDGDAARLQPGQIVDVGMAEGK